MACSHLRALRTGNGCANKQAKQGRDIVKTIVAPLGAVIVFACGLGAPAYAQDGKDPPGVNPTHYQCYQVKAPTKPVTLKFLRDQFGITGPVIVLSPLYLCAPTDKQGQPPKDNVTHYLCYQDKVKPAQRKVTIFNQFTTSNGLPVQVGGPAFLCVPSLKKD